MKLYVALSIIARILASILLVWAALTHNPASFYTLLRWIVFCAGAVSTHAALTVHRTLWALYFGSMAILFNPLIPVWLNRATWVKIDMVTGTLFLTSIFFVSKTRRVSAVSQLAASSGPIHQQTSDSQPSENSDKRVPSSTLPADIEVDTEFLEVLRKPENTKNTASVNLMHPSGSASTYHEREAQLEHTCSRAYEKWTPEEDKRLLELAEKGQRVSDISLHLQRQPGAIRSRLRKKRSESLHQETATLCTVRTIVRSDRPRTVRFLPIAISSMQGDAICVAGVDVDTLEWIRVVRAGKHSMRKSDRQWFDPARVYEILLLRNQPRSQLRDPQQLHVEDWIIKDQPRYIDTLSPHAKLSILQRLEDKDLGSSLLKKRSLFLIEPTTFQVIPRESKSPKIAFSVGTTNTDELRYDQRLQANHVGISSLGCPCTCLRWPELVRQLGNIRNQDVIRKLGNEAKIFFALSLTEWPLRFQPKKRKHYLLVAGIHVIGEEKVWL